MIMIILSICISSLYFCLDVCLPGTHTHILTSNTAARSEGQYFMRDEQRTCTQTFLISDVRGV